MFGEKEIQKKNRLNLSLLFLFLSLPLQTFATDQDTRNSTYYSYTITPLSALQTMKSSFVMSVEDLHKWDQFVYSLLKKEPHFEGSSFRLFAYLYTAQRDAAFLSYSIAGSFQGSLDLLSQWIIQLFHPKISTTFAIKTDPYSETLSKIVFEKYKARFEEEKVHIQENISYLLHVSYWSGHIPDFELNISSWRPWQIPNFLAGQLDRALMETRIDQNPSRENTSPFGSKSTSGKKDDWLRITNEYMIEKQVSFPKFILIRSLLAMALCDTLISAAQSSHPYESDDYNKISLMETVSATASRILSHFFPENQLEWEKLARENRQSTSKGGINYGFP